MRDIRLAALAAALCLAVPAGAAAQGLPPDVIILQNGGLVRGTIVENIPGDHVTIQLVTGEVRTFAAADVVHAGAATAEATPQPAAAVPVIAPPTRPTAHVRVQAATEEFVLHRVTGTATLRGYRATADSFEVLCTLPCEIDLEVGTYYFGLSRRQGAPVRWPDAFTLERDTTLALDFDERGLERLVGVVILVGGIAVGGAIIAAVIVDSFERMNHLSYRDGGAMAGLTIGGLFVIGAAAVGGYFAGLRDHVDLRRGALTF